VEEVELAGVEKDADFMSIPYHELEYRKGIARVGFLSMNLYDPPPEATWGLYNDRKINDGWVNDLVEAFKVRCDNCSEEDAIEIAIKPEWLKNRDQVSDL
jgi:hypothetical protein